jgi:SET domain-containing protein 6
LTTAAGIHSVERLEYLDHQDILDTGYDITASNPFTIQESLSPELVILVETFLLPSDEFERLKSKGKLPKPEKMTSEGAELLHKIVQARIAQYTTSLEEDTHSVNGAPSAGEGTLKERRYAMAKAVRIGEKQLLHQAESALAEYMARAGAAPKRQRSIDAEGDVEMGGVEKKHRV